MSLYRQRQLQTHACSVIRMLTCLTLTLTPSHTFLPNPFSTKQQPFVQGPSLCCPLTTGRVPHSRLHGTTPSPLIHSQQSHVPLHPASLPLPAYTTAHPPMASVQTMTTVSQFRMEYIAYVLQNLLTIVIHINDTGLQLKPLHLILDGHGMCYKHSIFLTQTHSPKPLNSSTQP